MIRIVLADVHTIMRDGIRALLNEEPELEVVAEAADGQTLLALLATLEADVVVLDLNIPGMDGLATIQQLQQLYPNTRILVLSMLNYEHHVAQTLDAGAHGYALKNTGRAELVFAIRMVAAGQLFLSTAIGIAALRRLYSPEAGAVAKTATLSKRELEVLKLIAEGMTNAEIAEKLFTSKRTIETHRQNIIEKTQAKNTAALIKFAVSSGLLTE